MRELQIGLVGLDTSHVVGFGDMYNRSGIPGARIVRAFPGGSAKFSLSRDRIAGFTAKLRDEYGVQIVESIDELAGLDAYLLESVDGDTHLREFEALARFGKPVFIDKPLACCYKDAKAIFDLAAAKGIPIMTTSSMRYAAGVGDQKDAGEVVSAEGFGPMSILPDYRDYFWYGIHSAEIVYRYLGKGCREVQTFSSESVDLIVGRWEGGRFGLVSGNRAGSNDFGVRLVTGKGHRASLLDPAVPYMKPLAEAILEFFRSGVSPIDPAESLEVIAFLEAASRSRSGDGKPVALLDI